jgi:translation initiation factor 2B subunit (eIF-2B alpha/beta/delta family)
VLILQALTLVALPQADVVLVGCDAVTLAGDVVNKVCGWDEHSRARIFF